MNVKPRYAQKSTWDHDIQLFVQSALNFRNFPDMILDPRAFLERLSSGDFFKILGGATPPLDRAPIGKYLENLDFPVFGDIYRWTGPYLHK